MYAQDSIDLLQNSGIQFKKHEEEGIDPMDFAELLMTSGIVLMDNIKWLSFHSGYDFGYLLKLLTDQNLPAEESEFFELLRLYFPNIYDVKYLMKSCKNLKGGLQEVADQLELRRVGPQHQAGSDSHLTGMAFFKMREVFDSVEFRLALKNSDKNLFWRFDEYSVAKLDANNNASFSLNNKNGKADDENVINNNIDGATVESPTTTPTTITATPNETTATATASANNQMSCVQSNTNGEWIQYELYFQIEATFQNRKLFHFQLFFKSNISYSNFQTMSSYLNKANI